MHQDLHQNVDGLPVTVNTERYIEQIRRKLIPALRRDREVDMDTVIHQQDEAAQHCSNDSLVHLHRYFIIEAGSSPVASHGPPSACTFSRPIPVELFSVGDS